MATALVTGASEGIGRALAAEFGRNGHDLILVARREDALADAAAAIEADHGVTADAIPQDLASREGRDSLLEAVADRRIDYLVNNVGIGTHGTFTETDLERELDTLQLNVATPVHLTHRLADPMRERGTGGVLNVASSAAFQPGPYMAGYYASKRYLLSFSQGLYEEFAGDGVVVTALCPGMVDTSFQAKAGNEEALIGSPTRFPRWLSAETVARAGYDGLMDGQAVVVPGVEYKLLRYVSGLAPSTLSRKVAKRANRD